VAIYMPEIMSLYSPKIYLVCIDRCNNDIINYEKLKASIKPEHNIYESGSISYKYLESNLKYYMENIRDLRLLFNTKIINLIEAHKQKLPKISEKDLVYQEKIKYREAYNARYLTEISDDTASQKTSTTIATTKQKAGTKAVKQPPAPTPTPKVKKQQPQSEDYYSDEYSEESEESIKLTKSKKLPLPPPPQSDDDYDSDDGDSSYSDDSDETTTTTKSSKLGASAPAASRSKAATLSFAEHQGSAPGPRSYN
jgi:hypothetical protein